jgi:YD repeat-containing protein
MASERLSARNDFASGGSGVLQSMLRVTVTTCAALVLACSYTYAQAPSISSISPNPMGIGQSVTISGTNFGSSGSVTFSGVSASTTSWTSTSIIATVPVGIANGNVIVTTGGNSSNSFPFTLNNGPVNYIYDDLGRLVGVIDVYGNAAEYSYDAVGNILSISRFNSNQVSIIQFTPESAPVGTLVTINGTGFSSTANQNTVTFNGSAATVSSATTTQLQATVPAGASTGPIAVTSPNGMATSSKSFTVTATNGTPTITSFSPANGLANTAVNIVGTNFDTTLANDRLRLNTSQAAVSSVTSTTIAATVPASTASGRFTLLTPAGTAVSSQDFYIPFGTHVPGDIGFTARIASGGNQQLTLAAHQIALLLFDGVQGQTVNVSDSSSSFSTCTLYLIAPDNSTVTSMNCAGNDSFTTVLSKTGTFTIGIDPGSSSGTITASLTADFMAQLMMPTPGNTGTATRSPGSGNLAVGQSAILTFDAGAGQKVSFNVLNSTIGTAYYSCNLKVYDQSKVNMLTSGYCGTGNTGYVDAVTLPTTETYFVDIIPVGTATGSVSVSLNNDADVTTPAITIDGASGQWSTTVSGQDVRLNFTPNSSQPRVAVYATDLSSTGQATVKLVNPSGSTQASMTITPGSQTFFMDTQPVAANQQYQLWVQHYLTYTEKQTLQIISVPNDFTGTLTVPSAGATGTAVRVPTTGTLAVGQNASLTFSATSGQKLSFNLSSSTIGTSYTACSLTVTGPSPSTTQITNGYCGTGNSGFVDAVTIPSTGTYTININPQGTATGSISVSINNDQDVTTPTISIDGGAVATGSTAPGQDVRLSFTPNSSQPRIFVQATGVTNPSATLNLWNGTSTQAHTSISNSPSGQTFYIDTQSVTANQQYQLWVQHYLANYGNETLQITTVPADLSQTVSVGGAAYQFSTVAGQNANIGFTISSSESVTVHWTTGTYPSSLSCYMRVTGPSPSTNQVGFGYCNTATGTLSLGTLSAGTYNILVDPQAQSAGGMSLNVTSP